MNYLNNKTPKILVIGDLMIDHYLWGSSDRISPEAPVPVVNIKRESIVLGGAGNVINNLKRMNANVDVIGVIGECKSSEELKSILKEINISSQYLITEKERITSKKTRIMASNQQVIRYDHGSTEEISSNTVAEILDIFKKNINSYNVILLSDYGKGLLTFELTQSLIKIARKNNKKLLVDPKGFDFSKYKGAYLLTPNKKEATEATQIVIDDETSLKKCIKQIKKQCQLDISLITLSEQGVAIYDNNLRIHPTAAIEVYDVTGAGDTVLASLGFALSCSMNIDDAVKFANLASGVVVGKIGSATASIQEIVQYESDLVRSHSFNKIKTFDEVKFIVNELKNKNKKIVFTNGCFDIIHLGHIKYLEKAKSFGDVMIVGLNSDNSIKKIKGKDRPINSQDDRAYIIASLKLIDFVVVFDDETPINLIKLIEPDILVKGGDYKGKNVVGQDIAKELKIVKFTNNKSTTKIIEKIQKL